MSNDDSRDSRARELHDRLGAMIDQVGQPDYSLRELVEGLRAVRTDLLALSESAVPESMLTEQLRGIVKHLRAVPKYRNLLGAADVIERAAKSLDALTAPVSMEGRWIPCSERLPEEADGDMRGYVLGWFPRSSADVTHFNNVRRWHLNQNRIEGAHWMRLPRAPRDGRKGG